MSKFDKVQHLSLFVSVLLEQFLLETIHQNNCISFAFILYLATILLLLLFRYSVSFLLLLSLIKIFSFSL